MYLGWDAVVRGDDDDENADAQMINAELWLLFVKYGQPTEAEFRVETEPPKAEQQLLKEVQLA